MTGEPSPDDRQAGGPAGRAGDGRGRSGGPAGARPGLAGSAAIDSDETRAPTPGLPSQRVCAGENDTAGRAGQEPGPACRICGVLLALSLYNILVADAGHGWMQADAAIHRLRARICGGRGPAHRPASGPGTPSRQAHAHAHARARARARTPTHTPTTHTHARAPVCVKGHEPRGAARAAASGAHGAHGATCDAESTLAGAADSRLSPGRVSASRAGNRF